jgi:AcrR family transcriptional regulator
MRQKLAKSAFQLFAKRGIKNVNLDEVAASAGVTKGSLYWHYKSKKEVILAACDYYYSQWHRQAAAAVAEDDDPLRQFERVLRFSVHSCLFDRANRGFTSEVWALSLQDRDVLAVRAKFYNEVCAEYARLLKAACERGQIQVADPLAAVQWMVAAIDGIKQRATFEPAICTPEHCDQMVEMLMRIMGEAARSEAPIPAAHPAEV